MSTQTQKKILSLLDVLGSTIVDIFYNHMYDRAISMKEKTEQNITTCYRTAISSYVDTRDGPEFYKTLVNSIHYYTRISTIYSELSFVDCINLYSSLFIPEVYLRSLSEKQKHDILSMILRETIKSFSDKLLADYLSIIIDEHQDPSNISLLQDCVLKELIKHRERNYSRFMNSEDKKKKPAESKKVLGPSKIIKTQKMLTKLNKLYRQALDERDKLRNRHSDLQIKYRSLADQSKEMQAMLINQIKLYREKENELDAARSHQESYAMDMPGNYPVAEATSPDYDGLFAVQYNE